MAPLKSPYPKMGGRHRNRVSKWSVGEVRGGCKFAPPPRCWRYKKGSAVRGLICYLHRTLLHFCICICYNVFAYVIVKRLFIVCLFCNMTCYASSMSACFCLYLCCFFVTYVHFNHVVAVHVNKLLLLIVIRLRQSSSPRTATQIFYRYT